MFAIRPSAFARDPQSAAAGAAGAVLAAVRETLAGASLTTAGRPGTPAVGIQLRWSRRPTARRGRKVRSIAGRSASPSTGDRVTSAEMAQNAVPAMLPFASSISLPIPIEVQRFERGHFVDGAGLHGHHFNEVIFFESAGDVHRVGGRETIANVGTVDAVGEGQIHNVELSAQARGWMLLFPDAAIQRTRLPLHVVDWTDARHRIRTRSAHTRRRPVSGRRRR